MTDNGGLRSPASQTTLIVNPATPTSGTALYRIHAGGDQVTTSLGPFAADRYASGGTTFTTDQPIAGTQDDALYQTERYGNAFSYAFPVSRGQQYQVVLHFAEVYATQAGQRVFDVAAEGNKVLDNYDIYSKVGAYTATTERFTVTVADDELNLDFSSLASEGGVDNAKVSAIEIYALGTTTPTAVLRLNAGSGQLTTSVGTFAADQYAAGGSVFSTDQAIAGTEDDALYQTERYGRFTYNLPVPNGQYTVKLHFAELYWNSTGQRVFDVAAEGRTVLNTYDIVKKVGPLTATIETFPVTVNDGQLTLAFTPGTGGVDQPKVSAIEVLEVAPTTVLRLKAGGDALNTSFGRFAADQFFAGGSDFATDQPIAGTEDDALYQTERYGNFVYSLPVPNGPYTVKLHFAELYWSAPGQRLFDVAAEGASVLRAYDIVKKVGPLTATTETFPVTVNDGVLSLAFAPGAAGVDQPKVSAIEVLSADQALPAVAARSSASPWQPFLWPNRRSTATKSNSFPTHLPMAASPSSCPLLFRVKSPTPWSLHWARL
ncbi:malectin (plasmid) [Hymenobacter volaticus]|uniref:Malectin n=1 Tax=Hymenobacter volaticus TaxID=2932254 RepID=A0ABY4GGA0_9BACT|nr:malectin [Hymenobacter volaticus]